MRVFWGGVSTVSIVPQVICFHLPQPGEKVYTDVTPYSVTPRTLRLSAEVDSSHQSFILQREGEYPNNYA